MVGGDPAQIRAMATAMRAEADGVDDQATAVRGVRGIEWVSTAADSFLVTIDRKSREMSEVSASIREAAEALDHLASSLESRQATLLSLLAEAGKTVAEAEAMIRNGVTDIVGEVGSLASAAQDGLENVVDGGRDVLGQVF